MCTSFSVAIGDEDDGIHKQELGKSSMQGYRPEQVTLPH